MKRMSFSMTTAAARAHTESVTRRLGWWSVKPGEVIMAIEKGMGLKKGEKQVEIGPFRVVSAKGEQVRDFFKYGPEECAREGFPDLTPVQFVAMFKRHHSIPDNWPVNRIEIEWL
jgi:hypothetical protein